MKKQTFLTLTLTLFVLGLSCNAYAMKRPCESSSAAADKNVLEAERSTLRYIIRLSPSQTFNRERLNHIKDLTGIHATFTRQMEETEDPNVYKKWKQLREDFERLNRIAIKQLTLLDNAQTTEVTDLASEIATTVSVTK